MISFKNADIKYPLFGNYFLKKKIFSIFKYQELNANKRFMDVLNNITIDLVKGDRVALIGNNGSGKTTFLRVLLNVLPIYSGYYQNTFKDILGLISLDSGLNHTLNAKKNIITINKIYNINEDLTEYDINNIIEFAELEKFLEIPIRKYSSGMKLRLIFSILTHKIKKCYIIDEWLSVGDRNFKKKSDDILNKILNNSDLLICASHNYDFLKTFCNKFLMFENQTIRIISRNDF